MPIKFQDGVFGTEAVTFEMIVCCDCKVPFMITASHRARLIKEKSAFHCPNGHRQSYTVSQCDIKINKIKEELEQAYRNNSITRNENWQLKQELRAKDKRECNICHKKVLHLEQHVKRNHPLDAG